MSESFSSTQEQRQRRAPRISARNVPALFSEGIEEDARRTERSRVKTVLPALLEKLAERAKTASQS